jgi:formamidopyrimidine-DNA glycosylase
VPELVEVERARAVIASSALGREIAAVEDGDTYVSRPHAPGEIAAALTGRRLVEACRRGKAMWCPTDGGPVLGLHLGMTGQILVDAEDAHPVWDRFVLHFADGGSLRLRDRRRLGRAVLDPDLSGLGPDAEDVGRAEFRERVGRSGAPLKARLMDQGVVSGLGNLLVDEILWQARLDPRRAANDLSDEELDALRRAVRATIRRTLRRGGSHTGEINPERVRGGHCPRCGAELARGRIGGRTTYWCPREQG